MNATATGAMARLHVRTCARTLLLWWALASGLVIAVFVSIASLYPSLMSRAAYAATAGTSTSVAAFNGRGYDLTTLGGIGAYEMGFMGQLLFPIVAMLLAIRFTRAAEDAGLTEWVTAYRVGGLAPLLSSMLVSAALWCAVGMTVGVGLGFVGRPWGGSVMYGAALAALSLFFAALGFVAAELAQTARTARMVALGVFGVLFLLRVVVDGAGLDAPALSPLGWYPEVRPWGSDQQWWPFVAYAVGILALTAAAVMVRLRRDMGGGLIAARPGPAAGSPKAATPARWALRMTLGGACGWVIGVVAWGAAVGLLANEMVAIIAENPSAAGVFGIDDPADLMSSMAGMLVVILAAACGVAAVLRLHTEEESGRLALVLAGRPSRRAVWSAWLGVACAHTLVVLVAGLAAYGLGAWATTGRARHVEVAGEMAWGYAGPALLVVTLAALIVAWRPAWSAASWLPVGWVTTVGFLAETLRMPEWLRHTSPAYAVGNIPVDDASIPIAVAITAAAVVAGALAVWGGNRRDLRAG